MRAISGFLYRNAVKPVLFRIPADSVHEFFLKSGKNIGKIGAAKKILHGIWASEDVRLENDVCGIHFKNPIGLSAGFDYDANLVDVLPSLGFGFHTIGTLTHGAYAGNEPPMLGRLPKYRDS